MSNSSAVPLPGFNNEISLFRDSVPDIRPVLHSKSTHWLKRPRSGARLRASVKAGVDPLSVLLSPAEPGGGNAGKARQNDSGIICRNDPRSAETCSEQQRQILKSRSGQDISGNQNPGDVFGFWNAQCLLSVWIEQTVEVHMSSVSGITGYDGPNQIQDQKTKSAGTKDLGEDQFLSLLVTQLKNQDPLQPMENTEFVTQLATFSSLEKLTSIESILKKSLSLFSEVSAEQENLNSAGA
jgi:hypothetical protein